MKVWKGHDPTLGDEGTDLLLTEHDDGSFELAARPGLDQNFIRWGPPATFTLDHTTEPESGVCKCPYPESCCDAGARR